VTGTALRPTLRTPPELRVTRECTSMNRIEGRAVVSAEERGLPALAP